jgi:hypothetical protein
VLAQWLGAPDAVRFYGFVALFLVYYFITTRIEQRCRQARAEATKDRRAEAPHHGGGGEPSAIQVK